MRITLFFMLVGCLDAYTTAETEQDLNGDTWSSVDDTNNNGLGATAAGVDITTSGKVFVVGSRNESAGGSSWTVRTSPTGANGSFTLDSTFHLATGHASAATHVVVQRGHGRVFVQGWANDASDAAHWIVREASTSNGSTFTTLFDVAAPSGVTVTPIALVSTSVGTFFALANFGGVTHVKYSTDGVVFADAVLPSSAATFYGGCTAPPNALIAVGTKIVNGQAYWYSSWTTDAAQPQYWTDLDTYSDGASSFQATSCVVNAEGQIFTAGTYQNASLRNWLVRQMIDGHPTWANVDVLSSPTTGSPVAMGSGPSSRTYMAGALEYSGSNTDWHVRRRNSSGTWVDSDNYHSFGPSAAASGYAYLPSSGATYVAGSLSIGHGIVKKLQ